MSELDPIEVFVCACGQSTTVTHWSWRTGVAVHDPELAFREQAGLDQIPDNPNANGTNREGE